MKFEYVVCKSVDGLMKVYVPLYREFTITSPNMGRMDTLEEAEAVVRENGGEVVKMMVVDAMGYPCFVQASHYPDGIID